jgi:hypothetical protein
MMADQ